MGQDVPNIGQMGIESIRIGGMTLDTLPMAEAALTKQQWSEKVADQKRQEVENILADSPHQKVSYLESRVVECQENIARIRTLKAGQQSMIDEYTGHISLCEHRDKEIAKLDHDRENMRISEHEHARLVKELKKQFPPYNVHAMQEQIDQCREAIVRSDSVIDQEFLSIDELKQVASLCRQRDKKLEPYGVKVG